MYGESGGDDMIQDKDWLDRSLDYLERHAARRAAAPSFDKRMLELHDRALRKLRRKIRKRIDAAMTQRTTTSIADARRKFKQLSFFALK
jgi:hypothetical protein